MLVDTTPCGQIWECTKAHVEAPGHERVSASCLSISLSLSLHSVMRAQSECVSRYKSRMRQLGGEQGLPSSHHCRFSRVADYHRFIPRISPLHALLETLGCACHTGALPCARFIGWRVV